MHDFRFRRALGIGILMFNCLVAFRVQAGGSGLNTIVVINQNSPDSCELANYFCERRQVPPENILRIYWSGNNISWTAGEFQTLLLTPLLSMLTARGLTNQADYVVLSMDIPFQTANGTYINSTTAGLFYGLYTMGGINSYAGSESIFQQAKPATVTGYSFLTTMITGDSLAKAKQLVDRGVASDGTFPVAPVVLARTSDPLRNGRYSAFDNAIFNTRLRGNYSVLRTNSDSPWGLTNLLGYQTGLASFTLSPGTFVPGAMADSLTSYGGVIFGPNDQTTLLAFLNAGASGSYGTVTEPFPNPKKFPDPQVYFYQARGFSLAECYYQSLVIPYQGLIVAEPLAAPFSRPGSGQWLGVSSNAVLTGTTPLSLQFAALDREHPLQRIDLFVDGKYFQTVTNLIPLAGNLLKVTLNGSTLSYTIPGNTTIAHIATQLAALVNAPSNLNLTGVAAAVHGDRIELSVPAPIRPPPPMNITLSTDQGSAIPAPAVSLVSNSAGTAPALSTFLLASRNTFLPSPVSALKAYIVEGTVQPGTWIRVSATKSTGEGVNVSVTNQSANATTFDLVNQLSNAIKSASRLQDFDSITADGLTRVSSTMASFEFRARNQGYRGSAIRVNLTGASNLAITPSTEVALDGNLSDVQPRDHLYVTAGTTNLAVTFQFNTTSLPDGFHDLTAVAYEGSHVRTQTRISVPVRIQNSSLSATLNLLDLADVGPVQGTYHLQVAANTTNIAAITLFSTGGILNTIFNQPSGTFTVDGSSLRAGLHPFYAVVETPTGMKYRTPTRWVRLIN